MQLLAAGLAVNTVLCSLSIQGNEIGPEGAWHLQRAMLDGAAVRDVDLEHSRVGAEGAAYLTIALQNLDCKLEGLELRGNRLGLTGAKHVAAALSACLSLRRLGLSSNALQDAGMQVLATALRKNTVLQELDLSENGIAYEGAKALAMVFREEAGMARSTLLRLYLQSNRIGPKGAASLAEAINDGASCNLEILKMGGNGIEDSGAREVATILCRLPRLHTLELQRNRIGEAGAEALAEAVKVRLTLQKVALHGNFVGDTYMPLIEDLCQVRSGRTTHKKRTGPKRIGSKTGSVHGSSAENEKVATDGPDDKDKLTTHFKTGLQLEVMDKLKRLGLPHPPTQTLNDMLDDLFVEECESGSHCDSEQRRLPKEPGQKFAHRQSTKHIAFDSKVTSNQHHRVSELNRSHLDRSMSRTSVKSRGSPSIFKSGGSNVVGSSCVGDISGKPSLDPLPSQSPCALRKS
jgi:hypothetical protein